MTLPSPLAYTPKQLRTVIPISRHRALQLAHEIGVQVSARRWLVPAVRLRRWLDEGGDAMANDPARGTETAPRAGAQEAV